MSHIKEKDQLVIHRGGKDVPNISHNVLKSIIWQEHPLSRLPLIGKFFDRIPAPDDHQLVVHIIGTPAQLRKQEEGFMHQCELFIDALNNKECRKDKDGNVIRPKFSCSAFVTYEKSAMFSIGPIIIEEPSVLPW